MPPVNSTEFYYSGSYQINADLVHISASQAIIFDGPISGSLSISGSIVATNVVKSGGTSMQILMADGSTRNLTISQFEPSGGNPGDIHFQYT